MPSGGAACHPRTHELGSGQRLCPTRCVKCVSIPTSVLVTPGTPEAARGVEGTLWPARGEQPATDLPRTRAGPRSSSEQRPWSPVSGRAPRLPQLWVSPCAAPSRGGDTDLLFGYSVGVISATLRPPVRKVGTVNFLWEDCKASAVCSGLRTLAPPPNQPQASGQPPVPDGSPEGEINGLFCVCRGGRTQLERNQVGSRSQAPLSLGGEPATRNRGVFSVITPSPLTGVVLEDVKVSALITFQEAKYFLKGM